MSTLESSPAPMSSVEIADLVQSIHIPARPSLLSELQQEMARDEPDFQHVMHLIGQDVAVSGALLKAANSVVFKLQRKAETIGAALVSLGLRQVSLLVGGFLVRKAFPSGHYELVHFWDQSAKRASAMSYLAGELGGAAPDLAHTFGLFADLGIPLLMERFSDYPETLALAHSSLAKPFTQVEDERHRTNHVVIGALLARNWSLPSDVVMAIRLHHDYTVFKLSHASPVVRRLIALGVISDIIIQRYQGQGLSAELRRGAGLALAELGIEANELEELGNSVCELLNREE